MNQLWAIIDIQKYWYPPEIIGLALKIKTFKFWRGPPKQALQNLNALSLKLDQWNF